MNFLSKLFEDSLDPHTFWPLERIGLNPFFNMSSTIQAFNLKPLDLTGYTTNPLLKFALKYPNSCLGGVGILALGVFITALVIPMMFSPLGALILPVILGAFVLGLGVYYGGCRFFSNKVRPLVVAHDAKSCPIPEKLIEAINTNVMIVPHKEISSSLCSNTPPFYFSPLTNMCSPSLFTVERVRHANQNQEKNQEGHALPFAFN